MILFKTKVKSEAFDSLGGKKLTNRINLSIPIYENFRTDVIYQFIGV
jgi:hypothetical protein